jgi:hypothetical protein
MIAALRIAICVALVGTLAQTPPRDPVRVAGGGVIRGRVVDAVTGRPLRRAVVSLSGIACATISTNSRGAFEFRDLAPAPYSLRVTRDGYLDAEYGQRHFSEAGRLIEVTEGQQVDAGVFRLLKKSTISGFITDDTGDPIAHVEVMPMQYKYFQGRKRYVPATGDRIFTDTTGFFRISGLAPGSYQLLATARRTWTIEEDGVRHVLAYTPTYFPGATSAGDEQSLKVGPGQDLTDVAFALTLGRTATITGTALDSRGVPLAGQTVHAVQEFRGPTTAMNISLPVVPIESDGSFIIRDVPPGEYLLRVAVVHTSRFPVEDLPAATPPPRPERSRVRLIVAGNDIHGVVIRTAPTVVATGRVESDDGVALPDGIRSVRLAARPADVVDSDLHPAAQSGRIRDDGTFEVGPLFGKYRFETTTLPPGWALRALLNGPDDVSVMLVEVYGPKQMSGLRAIFTNRTAMVSGTIAGADGKPTDGTVLLFSTNRDHWFEHSRFVRHARNDQAGRIVIRDVLPGDYYAIALPFIEQDQWHDPEYLGALRRTAVRITLGEREERQMTFVVKE